MRQVNGDGRETPIGADADVRVVFESTPADTAADGSTITHQIVRGWQLFVAWGEFGSATWPVLVEAVEKTMAEGANAIIVDLARTSAVDPQCVAELSRIERGLRHSGGDFRLVVDGVAVLQAIRAAGLGGRFEIHRYVGDIVGAVAGLDEVGRGKRRSGPRPSLITAHPAARHRGL